ncbi:hypothetical protein RCZ15_04640 [Capnocytophaga catalasegens]|uniref:Uncharacterized protein n=2 Tax=Capnocytophaga catalasegens TaxID=1004260 RepID=A0AAV5ASD7_9FLAO|nr:hypothetical protein RCZ03_22820 [Capnocytophaga catalasegens]GJM49489.1 hypothetical protein RCZ15_04640 [Capnocytophaga catalasegens]
MDKISSLSYKQYKPDKKRKIQILKFLLSIVFVLSFCYIMQPLHAKTTTRKFGYQQATFLVNSFVFVFNENIENQKHMGSKMKCTKTDKTKKPEKAFKIKELHKKSPIF